MAISQLTIPLGPMADQARIACSVSESGTTASVDAKASGPRSCFITLPVTGCFSSSPVSILYPRPTRRLRNVVRSVETEGVSSKNLRNCCWVSAEICGLAIAITVYLLLIAGRLTVGRRPWGLSHEATASLPALIDAECVQN